MSIAWSRLDVRLSAPGLRKGVIRRQRLIDRLHSQVPLRLQVVTAPAGYGKTTLLAGFAADIEAPVCWYSLDSGDQDPSQLFDGILESISARFPGFGESARRRLLEAESPTLDQLARLLTDAIASQIQDFFVLILDDLHLIDRSAPARAFLSRVLELAPEHCHVIMASRTQVELPVVSKLVLQGKAAVISAADLVVDADETRELAAEHGCAALSAEQAARLVEEADGWVMGVLLGIRALREGVATEAASPDELEAYLASEVYERQPPEVRDFLLRSSILSRLDPETCDGLFRSKDSRKMLRSLARNNLFIECIDRTKAYYRYHHLLRDFLRTKFCEEDPARWIEFHCRAAEIREASGDWSEAFSHAVAARRWSSCQRIITAAGPDLLKSGRWVTVIHWLDALPRSLRSDDAELVLLDAEARIHLGRNDEAARILTELLNGTGAAGNASIRGRALSLRSAAYRLGSYYREATTDILAAIKLLSRSSESSEALADAERRLAAIYVEQGRFSEALEHSRAALDLYRSGFNIRGMSLVHNTLGITHKRMGQLSEAKMHLEQARSGWTKLDNLGMLAMTLNNIGIVYQRLGQYDLALDTLRSGLENARESGYQRVEAGTLVTIGEVLRDAGRYQEALESFQVGLTKSRRLMEASFVAYATAGLGECYRLVGEREKARILLEEARHQAEEQEQPYEGALFSLQLGVLHYEAGQPDVAVGTLQAACDLLLRMGDKDALGRAYLHLAQAFFAARDYEEALKWLAKASSMADELGYDDFLAVAARNAAPLLQLGIAKGIGKDRLIRILDRIKAARQERRSAPAVGAEQVTRPDIVVHSLGETEVVLGNRPVAEQDWRSTRAKELFFYLLAHPAGQTREQVTAAMWPDFSPSKASSNFHINLFRARRALFPGVFTIDGGRYRIARELTVWFDAAEFEGLVAGAERPKGEERDLPSVLERAVGLYRGEFLPEFYSEWVVDARRGLENKFLRALLALADDHSARNNHSRAIPLLERLLAIDPYQEDAYIRIVRSYLAEGKRALALRTYSHYLKIAGPQDSVRKAISFREFSERIFADVPRGQAGSR